MSVPPARIRPATEADLEAINRIYNHEVLHGVATWDIDPWPPERRRAWWRDQQAAAMPVLVAEVAGAADDAASGKTPAARDPGEVAGEIAGFGYLSRYHEKPGYRYTCADTLYLDERHQGRGIGRALLTRLVEEARAKRMRAVVAGIESENARSLALHASLGFTEVSRMPALGRKFGRWLTLVQMQLLFDDFAPGDE